MPVPHKNRRSAVRRTVRTWLTQMTAPDRLLLAGKTALAAALAWQLAPFVPFADPQYSYYAPLGVLVSMYPTIARSSRAALQMLAGLLLGIGLGLAGIGLVVAGLPGAAAVAFVTGVGMVGAAVGALGPGASWVPIAALFVLLVGGGSADEFSLNYLVNVAFGVVVGVVVNLVVFPPLYLVRASRRLNLLREAVSDRMRGMAESLVGATIDADALRREAEELLRTVADVREEVREADESRKSNPRGRNRSADDELNYRRLRALERTVLLVQGLADGLGRLQVGESERDDLAVAIRQVADLVATPPDAAESAQRLAEAERAVEGLLATVDRKAAGRPSAVTVDLMIADSLRRMVDVSRPFVRQSQRE